MGRPTGGPMRPGPGAGGGAAAAGAENPGTLQKSPVRNSGIPVGLPEVRRLLSHPA